MKQFPRLRLRFTNASLFLIPVSIPVSNPVSLQLLVSSLFHLPILSPSLPPFLPESKFISVPIWCSFAIANANENLISRPKSVCICSGISLCLSVYLSVCLLSPWFCLCLYMYVLVSLDHFVGQCRCCVTHCVCSPVSRCEIADVVLAP